MTQEVKPVRIERQSEGTFRLTTAVLLPRSAERVFQFFSDTNNLDTVMPRWLGLRVLTPAPIEMHMAIRIRYQLRIHGVPARWESEITAWEPPFRFVYEAVPRALQELGARAHVSLTATKARWLVTTSTTAYPAGGVSRGQD
jgi:ligand-binding SRPBCC domain-containing protein